MNLRVSYPKGWVEKSRGVFVGSDGYLIIKKLDQYNSLELLHVAVDFANSNYASDTLSMSCAGWGYGCVIMDDAYRGGAESPKNGKLVSLIPYDQRKDSEKYFSMEMPAEYFRVIESSLVVTMPTEEPTKPVKRIPTPKPVKKRFAEGITLEELSSPSLTTDWYTGGYFRAEEINFYCGINANRKNQDFSMDASGISRINVNYKDQKIYSYAGLAFAIDYPDSFCAWDDNWMFETHDIVVMNGKVLNHELGYDEIFSWHLLGDKPTFFVKNKGKYQISFDGKLIPLAYDEIFHYWCEDREFCGTKISESPHTDGTKTWFKARRDNAWFTVIISVN